MLQNSLAPKTAVLLNDASGAQTGEDVGAACEATYLSIQETVEHRNHKALWGWGDGGGAKTEEFLVRQAK